MYKMIRTWVPSRPPGGAYVFVHLGGYIVRFGGVPEGGRR